MSHSDEPELRLTPTNEELTLTTTEKTVVHHDAMDVEGEIQETESSKSPTGNADSATRSLQPLGQTEDPSNIASNVFFKNILTYKNCTKVIYI